MRKIRQGGCWPSENHWRPVSRILAQSTCDKSVIAAHDRRGCLTRRQPRRRTFFAASAALAVHSVIVRGIGPSLADFGLSPVLPDPTLELRNSDGAQVAVDNDWQDDPTQAAFITAAGLAPARPQESAIFKSLAPGAYTALLSGVGGGTGLGLVEVYDNPVIGATATPGPWAASSSRASRETTSSPN